MVMMMRLHKVRGGGGRKFIQEEEAEAEERLFKGKHSSNTREEDDSYLSSVRPPETVRKGRFAHLVPDLIPPPCRNPPGSRRTAPPHSTRDSERENIQGYSIDRNSTTGGPGLESKAPPGDRPGRRGN